MSEQFDPAKPCCARDKREVEILRTDCVGDYPILGRIKCMNGWQAIAWTAGGHSTKGFDSYDDLVNVTPDVVEYCNVYPNGLGDTDGWRSRSGADSKADHQRRIAVLKITIRDGREVSVEVEHV